MALCHDNLGQSGNKQRSPAARTGDAEFSDYSLKMNTPEAAGLCLGQVCMGVARRKYFRVLNEAAHSRDIPEGPPDRTTAPTQMVSTEDSGCFECCE